MISTRKKQPKHGPEAGFPVRQELVLHELPNNDSRTFLFPLFGNVSLPFRVLVFLLLAVTIYGSSTTQLPGIKWPPKVARLLR